MTAGDFYGAELLSVTNPSDAELIAALRDEFDLDEPDVQAALRDTAVQQYQNRETGTDCELT